MTVKDFEIMAPVGSYESLTAAIQGGAGSIYFGVEGLNMRARSSNNFTLDDLREIARICRENGMKSYLTVNTVIYDNDIELMRRIIDAARDAGISAIIASDIAAMTYARQHRRGGAPVDPAQHHQHRSPQILRPIRRCRRIGPRTQSRTGNPYPSRNRAATHHRPGR